MRSKVFLFLPAILLGGFIVRVLLYKTGTFFIDVNSFIAWSNILLEKGLKGFYGSVWSDYLPGYLYVLFLLGKIKEALPINELLLFKLPAVLADLATGWLIFSIVKKIKGEKLGLIAASLYVFNPAILANSTLWGQVDSLTALLLLLSIYLVKKYPIGSGIALSLGALIKPQVAIAAPIILFILLREKWPLKKILGYVLFSLSLFILGFIPFYFGEGSLLQFIFARISATLNQYPFGSVNAFNLWGLWGFWKPDSAVKFLGLGIFGAVSLYSILRFRKKEGSEYLLASILAAANFLFFTRMHERHLLPALAPLLVAAFINPPLLISYFGFSATYVLNLYYAFEQQLPVRSGIYTQFTLKAMILANLAFFFFLFLKEKIKVKSRVLSQKVKSISFPKINFSKRTLRIFLFLVLGFSLLSRILWLGSPPNEYFDEVYHAFTARRILHSDPKAWEWWNTPPEGFAYEWTHPPLAKLGMVVGMLIFGENSFGWRIPGALLGIGSTFLIYLIAKNLFKDEIVGILSAATFALDGLALVMSRIGMNDSYLLFFVLLSVYFYLKDKNFFSALAFGLAISSKWSAVWAAPVLLLAHFVLKRKIKLSYLFFLILPPLVYLAGYIPMFLTGHGLDIFWGVQKQMWWYHTRLVATHAYTSSWASWPFLVRPIYLYTSSEIGGVVSRIYAMGNPVVFWVGVLAILSAIIYSIQERSRSLALTIFSYLIFFVPWAASPRIMFLYHYLPSIPFLAIATGFFLRRNPRLTIPFLAIGVFTFIYFFPHWAGLPVSLGLDKSFYWFDSWR